MTSRAFTFCMSPDKRLCSTRRGAWVLFTALAVAMILAGATNHEVSAATKRKPAYRAEPDLRIVSVSASPEPYAAGFGSLDLAIEVELPSDLEGATLLEVSSLISSPSKRSLRFLANRQPVGPPPPGTSSPPSGQGAPSSAAAPQRIVVTLSWDGTDQTRQLVADGQYHYEVRAKLLGKGENGPRTQMVSWPKRGKIEVK